MTMKTKKAKRIKGTVSTGLFDKPSLILPIDDIDALVEQVARALDNEYWNDFMGEPDDKALARAALRSIGVPLDDL